MPSNTEADVVKRIIKRFGPVIDLRKEPEVILEIIRVFRAFDVPEGGLPPGGTPPPPPPGPDIPRGEIFLVDIMAKVLELSRSVNKVSKDVATIKATVVSSKTTKK